MSCAGAEFGHDRRSWRGTTSASTPTRAGGPGLRVLIPGYPQWAWRQRERALVLIGSYAVALGVGLFAWGTPIGLAILAFAYGTHVVSAADAVRQGAFPGFGRWVPMISATGGLGMGIYLPAVAMATLFAWPEPGVG